MVHQNHIVCALVTDQLRMRFPLHVPRKKRSLTEIRHDKSVVSSGRTMGLMFNETDFAKLKFKVNFRKRLTKCCREKVLIESVKNEEHYQLVQSQQCSSPLLQPGQNASDLKKKCGRENGISTSRNRIGKMVQEARCTNRIEVVAPQTPSPTKGKRARGSITVELGPLKSDATVKRQKKTLQHVSEKAENAYYYTRHLNKLVMNEIQHEQGDGNLPYTDTDTQRQHSVGQVQTDVTAVSLKGNEKQPKRVPHPSGTAITRAWKELLSESTVESSGTLLNEVVGVCREVSFIHKVSCIQGSRAYLPWKGSVLDSVIGALMTQRVSDKFSSSAFMALGKRFPQFPACEPYSRNHRMLREKRSNVGFYQCLLASGSNVNLPIVEENASKFGKASRKLFDEKNKGASRTGEISRSKNHKLDWNNLRSECSKDAIQERESSAVDFVDWHAVHRADVKDISEAISKRGMFQKLATRTKDFLNRIVSEHGNLDLEWLKRACPEKAKEFLLSIFGIGLKSAECVRLLSLRQPAFPVDVNVARVTVRLGWVPAPSISDKLLLDLLQQNSKMHDRIHQYLWSRLCKFDIDILYQLHCQMITFGKVFCKKQEPNCGQCPMRRECRYHSDELNRKKVRLSQRSLVSDTVHAVCEDTSLLMDRSRSCFQVTDIEEFSKTVANSAVQVSKGRKRKCNVKGESTDIIPAECILAPKTPVKGLSPRSQRNTYREAKETSSPIDKSRPCFQEMDAEDFSKTEDKLAILVNCENKKSAVQAEFPEIIPAQCIQAPKTPVKDHSRRGQRHTYRGGTSRNLPHNKSKTRTEHLVYELPDWHPILERFDDRDPDDPSPYLLVIWRSGLHESKKSGEPLANDSSSGSTSAGSKSRAVPGTIMIPYRTALKGMFPLNGTHFQTNEVFADRQTSISPVDVLCKTLHGLPRKTLYCGTDLSRIAKGLSANEIQSLFSEGYICTREFDRETTGTGTLQDRLHTRQGRKKDRV